MVKDQISFIRNRAQKITPKSGTISRFSLKHAQWYQYHHLAISISSAHLPCNTKMAREEQLCPFVPTARTEGAGWARACRSAPDALVCPMPYCISGKKHGTATSEPRDGLHPPAEALPMRRKAGSNPGLSISRDGYASCRSRQTPNALLIRSTASSNEPGTPIVFGSSGNDS